jgi:hypothetical protein
MGSQKRLLKIWSAIVGGAAICAAGTAFADTANTQGSVPIVLAQAGSVGGTIGKQGKSASGGEVESKPRRRPSPQSSRAAKPEKEDRRMSGLSGAASRKFMEGQWKWNAICGIFNLGGVSTLAQTTASTFHGSLTGQGSGNSDPITDGTIRGKHVSFLRHEGNGVVERYDADLISMEPPTLQGNHVHYAAGACHFTGTKMN